MCSTYFSDWFLEIARVSYLKCAFFIISGLTMFQKNTSRRLKENVKWLIKPSLHILTLGWNKAKVVIVMAYLFADFIFSRAVKRIIYKVLRNKLIEYLNSYLNLRGHKIYIYGKKDSCDFVNSKTFKFPAQIFNQQATIR